MSENLLVNLLGFQLSWWAAVLFGDWAWPLLAILLMLHLCLHRQPLQEAKVIFLAAGIGYTVDGLLTVVGLFQFATASLTPPLWLAMLWLCFAATLRQGLSWFSDHLGLASLAGAIAGAGSYIAGAQLGAVTLALPMPLALTVLAVVWALLFPALLVLSMLLSGNRAREERA